MSEYLEDSIKVKPRVGTNAMNAEQILDMYLDEYPVAKIDAELARLGGTGPSIVAERNAFAAGIMEPILQMVPYVTLYDKFFMPATIQQGADNLVPVEDNLVSIAWTSHPQTGVAYVRPGYLFSRPTFTTFSTGFEIPWAMVSKAGWNVLQRQMNYAVWAMAKLRDAAAKTVIDAAIPASHQTSVSTTLTKASVDAILIASAKIGFPVKQALINPGILMSMQGWTWGGTGFFISPEKSNELLDNLFISTYGNLKWFASPYVPVDKVYFAGDPTQIGWHQTKGTPRQDTALDISLGIDKYTIRDAEHAYYVQSGLSLYSISIT